MLCFLKYILSMHKFFVKKSRSFVGVWVKKSEYYKNVRFGYYKYSFRQKLYYPIAYCKFMYYAFKDYKYKIK